MGLKINNQNNYDLNNDISNFFNLPIEETKKDKYSNLKENIYSLDIDVEEKADIINKINSLSFHLSSKEREQIEKEIKSFKQKYNI